jgi:hypothetical protein
MTTSTPTPDTSGAHLFRAGSADPNTMDLRAAIAPYQVGPHEVPGTVSIAACDGCGEYECLTPHDCADQLAAEAALARSEAEA